MRLLGYVVAALASSFLLAGCGTAYRSVPDGMVHTSPTAVSTDPFSGLPWVKTSHITPEGRDVLREIDRGGPFEYPGKDGSVFGNFEGVLPKQARGCYHEYTVDTPGISNRGTRRIITGCHHDFYWTADHYQHFERIKR